MRSDNYNRMIQSRCPECRSRDIHKRVRRYNTITTKIYRCYECGHEFNSPFFGPKKLQDEEGEKAKRRKKRRKNEAEKGEEDKSEEQCILSKTGE